MTPTKLISAIDAELARPLLPPSDWLKRARAELKRSRRILREPDGTRADLRPAA